MFAYPGDFKIAPMRDWLDNLTQIMPTKLSSSSKRAFKTINSKALCVGYFGKNDWKFDAFRAMAAQHQSVQFYYSFNPELKKQNAGNTLTIFRNHGNTQFDFNESWDADNLDDFLNKFKNKSVTNLSDSGQLDRITKDFTPTVVFFAKNFDNHDGAQDPYFENAKKFGERYRNKVAFMYADVNSEEAQSLLNFVGESGVKSTL